MADIRKGFTQSESVQNISHVRTPMTPDNRYKRIGLLMLGAACIIAGIIIAIMTSNSNASTTTAETTTVETTVTAG